MLERSLHSSKPTCEQASQAIFKIAKGTCASNVFNCFLKTRLNINGVFVETFILDTRIIFFLSKKRHRVFTSAFYMYKRCSSFQILLCAFRISSGSDKLIENSDTRTYESSEADFHLFFFFTSTSKSCLAINMHLIKI